MKSHLGTIDLSPDIIDKSHIGLWAFELDEGHLPRMYVNDVMLELLGLKEQTTPELTYHAWYDNVDPTAYGLVNEAVDKMAAGEDAEVQYPWHHPDGHTMTVRCGGVRNFAYTSGIRIEGYHQDVTQLLSYNKTYIDHLAAELDRQKQRLTNDYRTIQGLAGEYDTLHLINLKTDKYIPYFIENEAYSESLIMADYPDFFSAHKACMEKFCHPDHLERMLQFCSKDYIRDILKDQKRHIEHLLLSVNGIDYTWFEFVIIKFAAQNQEAEQIAVGYINVDAAVRKEKEQQEAAERAGQEKERYNFLVNVSHELRTPLTLIIGPLRRVLNTEQLSPKAKSTITHACQQADKMTYLLNTVLTTNKIEEGAESVRPEPINLNQWVSSTADEFRDEAENHNMGIEVNLDPTIGTAQLDPHLCKIVFSNFMMNAMRHNAPGQPIEVKTRWSSDGQRVHISVKDHGSGIGEINADDLFYRYYRATEEKTGFGIGLSYSKTIVDAHNGIIGAKNNDGDKGATFWFEIPADESTRINVAPEPAAAESEAPAKQGPARIPEKLSEKTLLYVEDDRDLRDYLCTEMDGICGKVLTAYNGRNALEVLEKNAVHVIITDVMMPEVDGLELCHIVKTDPRFKHIPVIMLSARADAESIKKGYEAMADQYMDKPFDIDELIDVLENKLK